VRGTHEWCFVRVDQTDGVRRRGNQRISVLRSSGKQMAYPTSSLLLNTLVVYVCVHSALGTRLFVPSLAGRAARWLRIQADKMVVAPALPLVFSSALRVARSARSVPPLPPLLARDSSHPMLLQCLGQTEISSEVTQIGRSRRTYCSLGPACMCIHYHLGQVHVRPVIVCVYKLGDR
jgi:hypothetical protein